MSDTTPAVSKTEDKPTEVAPPVEPSTEVETPAPVPDAPKEDVKAAEPTNTETSPVNDQTAEPSAPEPKESSEDAKPAGTAKEDRPKSPNFLSRLISAVRRSDKKKEKAPVPATEEPAVPAEEPSPADPKPEDKPAPETTQGAPADPVEETETAPAPAESDAPVPQTTEPESEGGIVKKEEVKEVVNKVKGTSPLRVARRLSVRVGELFKGGKKEVDTPAKVDEEPPKIEEPTPVAPLENPAADSTPANGKKPQETEAANEPPKIIDASPPPVAATA